MQLSVVLFGRNDEYRIEIKAVVISVDRD